MTGRISKFLVKAVHGVVDQFVGFFIGVIMAVLLISQHPVISKIVKSEGNDRETRFVVACQASADGQVKCSTEEELVNAN